MEHTAILPHGTAAHVFAPAMELHPTPAIARILAGFERDQLASFIEVAIGLLDVIEPESIAIASCAR